ncbi:hypothetical protein Pint_35828 [Pistacia integerrima]|uniref:Uncharacterized protein n=1 Tax=Pistacia integerrima TaxID=434235 RepID=A0ACC0Y3I8_9ROSI|nr:hypothetical protein Pint_35828 [Pistacia integerrima]
MVVTSGRGSDMHPIEGASIRWGKAVRVTIVVPSTVETLARSWPNGAKVDPLRVVKPRNNSRHPLPSDELGCIKEEFGLVGTLHHAKDCSLNSLHASWVATLEILLFRVSVPPHKFISVVLERFGIVPLQLTANSYLCMIGMYIAY